MTTPRALPNNAKHAVEDAIDEAQAALKELLPVLRGEKETVAGWRSSISTGS